MRRFVLGWKTLGHGSRLQARIVNYADDFVICCRGTADEALTVMRDMMARLKLTVNEAKTRRCILPADEFDFLGYTIGLCHKAKTGRPYLGTRPSAKKVARLIREISEQTQRRYLAVLEPKELVGQLNRKQTGWANYFCLGPVSKAYRAVDHHVCRRLRQWICAKHKVPGRGTTRFPNQHLYQQLHLVPLSARTRSFPWAKA